MNSFSRNFIKIGHKYHHLTCINNTTSLAKLCVIFPSKFYSTDKSSDNIEEASYTMTSDSYWDNMSDTQQSNIDPNISSKQTNAEPNVSSTQSNIKPNIPSRPSNTNNESNMDSMNTDSKGTEEYKPMDVTPEDFADAFIELLNDFNGIEDIPDEDREGLRNLVKKKAAETKSKV